jgi:hypothetical protein
MCIIHKGFRGFRALSPASVLGGNLIPLESEIPYEIIHSTLATNLMKREIYILLAVCITILSCNQKPIDNQLKVFGYSLGDSINNDFVKLEKYGETVGLIAFKQDERFTARTIENHLFAISATNLTDTEFKEFKNVLIQNLGQKPEHFIRKTHYGMNIKGEEFYWNDTTTHYEYSLGITYKKDSTYSMTIENAFIRDSLGNAFIKDFGKETIIEVAEPKQK